MPNRFGIEVPGNDGPLPPAIPSTSGPPIPSGPIESGIGAFVKGFRNDPLQGLLANQVADLFPGVDRETLNQLEARAAGGALGKVIEVVGEYGPLLIGGVAAFNIGRRAVTSVAARLSPKAAAFATTLTDASLAPIAKPFITRGAEIAGGALGIGAFEGARSTAAGNPPSKIAQDVAIGAALAGTTELAFTGIGRFLTGRARDVSPGAVQAQVAAAAPARVALRELAEKKVAGSQAQLQRLTGRLNEALDTESQMRSILNFANTPASRRKAISRAVGRAERAVRGAREKVRQAEQANRSLTRFSVAPGLEITTNLLRETPLNPTTAFGADAQKILSEIVKTPEGLGRQLGLTMTRFVKEVSDAEMAIQFGSRSLTVKVAEMNRAVARQFGTKVGTKKFDQGLRQAFRVFEREGVEEASRRFPQLGETFRNYKDVKALASRVEAIGGAELLGDDALRRLGTREFIPRVFDFDKVGTKEFQDRLVKGTVTALKKKGFTEEAAKLQAERTAAILAKNSSGLQKFGSIDHHRGIPGSLDELIEAGIPFEGNPINAYARYGEALIRRLQYGERFGFRGEVGDDIVALATAEGASGPLSRSLVDHFLSRRFAPQATRRFFETAVSLQNGAKLSLAVIPNASQSINTIMFAGMGNTLRAMRSKLASPKGGQVEEALGISENIFQAMRRAHLLSPRNNFADKFSNTVLTGTGFSLVERFNRTIGGLAGLYDVRRTFAQALTGRLRGPTLEHARRRFQALGLDLGDLTKQGRALQAQGVTGFDDVFTRVFEAGAQKVAGIPTKLSPLERAITRAAEVTQFTPDPTRRPMWWNTPWGRMIFQFKTFALNQGRFLRDQVLAEAARGNVRPLGYFVSLYPLAGELVRDGVSLARQRPREENGLVRYLDNLTAVGGFGIASSFYTAARFGRLADAVAGPTVSDVLGFTEALASGGLDSMFKRLARQPIATTTGLLFQAGGATVEGIGGALGSLQDNDEGDQGVNFGVPLQQLLVERKE